MPAEVPKRSSWGGARAGAGRPMIYKTAEDRRRRKRELSHLRFLQWLSKPENARRYEESRAQAEEQRVAIRKALAELEQKRTSHQSKNDEWEQLKRRLREQHLKG